MLERRGISHSYPRRRRGMRHIGVSAMNSHGKARCAAYMTPLWRTST